MLFKDKPQNVLNLESFSEIVLALSHFELSTMFYPALSVIKCFSTHRKLKVTFDLEILNPPSILTPFSECC